jgi:hypothetical protein
MAKKKPKKTTPADRYGTQVDAESTLKFGPEESTLAQQLRDADTTYGTDVAAAHGTRRAIEEAARTSGPKLKRTYETAEGTVAGTKRSLMQDLSSLPNAGPIAGAAARDAAGTERRLAEALASASAETTSRARDAASGEGYAIASAGQRRDVTHDKVAARETELAREKGAFAQGRSGELVEAGRNRAVTRRGQDKTSETAAANRRTQNKNQDATRKETERHNREIEKAARDKKHKKKSDPKAQQKFATDFTRAKAQVERVRAEVSDKDKAAGKTERSRSEVAGIVVNGRPGQTIENDAKGNPLPNKVVIPKVSPTDQLVTSVALDVAYDGHISTANLKKLHALGISVRELGISTAGRSGTKGAKPTGTVSPLPQPSSLPSGVGALGRPSAPVFPIGVNG